MSLWAEVPLFPEQASELAGRVDRLFFFLLVVTGLVAAAVVVLMLAFIARYHRSRRNRHTPDIKGSNLLETIWTVAPVFVFAVMFVWGADVYHTNLAPPPDAPEVYVVGKQWMWKLQHAGGRRETNELHLPVGRPVKLVLTSADVIHDFAVPAFRSKIDVIPGRYVSTWYLPTKTGRYHLFCDQYCGTSHAEMVGTVVVLEPAEYERWANDRAEGSPALEGRKLFLKLQCITCHSADSRARAPVLEGLYGTTVALQGGGTAVADDNYLRESILNPRAKVVQGYEPIMPSFQGQIGEEDLIELIAFVKSLRPGGHPHSGSTPDRTESFPAPVGAPTTPEGRSQKP